jgi:hypothetical protein
MSGDHGRVIALAGGFCLRIPNLAGMHDWQAVAEYLHNALFFGG